MGIHLGSCHCGAVRLRIDTDEPLGPYFRCDCLLCSRKGAVMGEAARSALEITAGAQQLATYAWNTGEAQHHFCKVCGIYSCALRLDREALGALLGHARKTLRL